jgi:hypothetical protein
MGFSATLAVLVAIAAERFTTAINIRFRDKPAKLENCAREGACPPERQENATPETGSWIHILASPEPLIL